MKFQLSTIVAFLLLFLTGHSLAYNRCYSGGMKWSDLGTEAELSEALIGLCDMFAGTQQISQKVRQAITAINCCDSLWPNVLTTKITQTSHCINIGDNHIVGSIKITDGPADGVFIDLVACISAMLKVSSKSDPTGASIQRTDTDVNVLGPADMHPEFWGRALGHQDYEQ